MRKQRIALYCVVVLIVALLFTIIFDNEKTELRFSVNPGFYDQPFWLEIYSPANMTVYYTLDGSTPTENSIKYEGPIYIDNVTKQANTLSDNSDIAAEMSEEFMQLGIGESQFSVPDYLVDKCVVIRAIAYDKNGDYTEVKTANYFVGYDNNMAYQDMYVITLNTDPDYFFDYDDGIYVLGKSFGDYKNLGNISDDYEEWPANYRNSGPEWVKETNVCIFRDGQEIVNSNATVQVSGQISRIYLPRSLTIKAKDAVGDDYRFYGFEFSDGYFADSINISSGGNRFLSKMNDYLVNQLVSDREFATMEYHPCYVFLDGEFWGTYLFSDKYSNAYFKDIYGIDKEQLVYIKNGQLNEGTISDYDDYCELLNYMKTADFTDGQNYNNLCEIIDIDSYIDYYAVELFIARQVDWPVLNEGIWRSREKTDDSYADGKWRWALFDVNSVCMHDYLLYDDTINLLRTSEDGQAFDNLCKNKAFAEKFVITSMDIINDDFNPQNVNMLIDQYYLSMIEPLKMSSERFCGEDNEDVIYEEIEDVRFFLINRKKHYIDFLANNFDLNPLVTRVNLSINDSNAGDVQLNTLNIAFVENTWGGDYFKDYPITIMAKEKKGFHFVGWTGDVDSQENVLILDLNSFDSDVINIEAIYKPD